VAHEVAARANFHLEINRIICDVTASLTVTDDDASPWALLIKADFRLLNLSLLLLGDSSLLVRLQNYPPEIKVRVRLWP
jgi:hypothetical protein